jgi:hypothetical protein
VETLNFVRQKNGQIAADNMKAIIDQIQVFYPTVTFADMAEKTGITEGGVLNWYKTDFARKAGAEKLVAAFPIPPVGSSESVTDITVATWIDDKILALTKELKNLRFLRQMFKV